MGFSKERKAKLERIESENTKHCSRCKEIKPLFEFGISSTGRKMSSPYCRECERKRAKEKHIQTRHNIFLSDYDKILKKQDGKCKICKTTKIKYKNKGRFCVDHDHKTGKIRGLLCVHCNLLLGHSKDNIEILAAAIQYLINSRK